MEIYVKNGSETVIFRSVDEIINSKFEVDTVEFYLSKTVETKLEQRAFETLKEKIQNEKYRLRLEGIQIVAVLEPENQKNLKQEIKKCVEYMNEIIDQIRIDNDIQRQIRQKACVLGNLINGELRVEMI